VSLEELFKEIQDKSEFIFFYKDDVLNHRVSLHLRKATLATILDAALANTNLTYSVDYRQVVIQENTDSRTSALDSKVFQQNPIKGTVLDETGAPLIGASIIVKGTTIGVSTDFDGNFELSVPDGITTL